MGPSPLTLLRDNTDVTVADTTSETALFTYTIPAYTLDGDRGLRVTLDAAKRNYSGSTVAWTLRFYLGTTVVWQDGDTGESSADTVKPLKFIFDVMAKNSDSAQEVFGTVWVGHGSLPDVGEGGIAGGAHFNFYGESAEDGTTDLDFKVTIEMTVADAETWWMHRRSIVELL